ncbi:hypothetical protein GZL_07385 [Streptomyces sp. 769]|nr:hypothetical protein GZL_07385 [Streptomyces sp. 769]
MEISTGSVLRKPAAHDVGVITLIRGALVKSCGAG